MHPIGLAATQAIKSASAALPSRNFSEKIQQSLEISAELDDSVAANFVSDVDVLRRGTPFSDGSLLSDGTGFAISSEELYLSPLWKTAPLHIQHFAVPQPKTPWKFWEEWHRAFWESKPLSSSLQSEVARIADPIWEAGPGAVAAEIERIKAEMLSEKLPMAETIELNPETGQFRAVPIPVENAPYMSALLSQISDALEDSLGGHNGLSERSGDTKKLNRVLTKYKDDPQNAELTLTRVAGSLRAQLHDSRELPDNEDNLALLNAVEEGVRGIRANHPEVAANREQLAQQAFKALAPEDKQVLEEALPVLTAISEPELAEDFAQDIPELINDARLPLPDGAPPLPGADAATRVFSRVSKMALLQEQYSKLTRKGAEWFDSDTRKTVQLAGLVGGSAIAAWVNFGPKLLEFVQIGLRLLGVL